MMNDSKIVLLKGDEIHFELYAPIWSGDISIAIELADKSTIDYKSWVDNDTQPKHELYDGSYIFSENPPETIILYVNDIESPFAMRFSYKKDTIVRISYNRLGGMVEDSVYEKIDHIIFEPDGYDGLKVGIFTENQMKDMEIERLNRKIVELTDFIGTRMDDVINGDKMEGIMSEIAALDIEYSELTSLYNTKTNELRHIQSDIKSMDNMILLRSKEIQDARSKLDLIRKDLNALDEGYQDDLNELKEVVNVDENILRYYDTDNPELRERLKCLKSEIADIETRLAILINSRQQNQDEIEKKVDSGD